MRSSIFLSGKRDLDLIALYKKVGRSEFQRLIKDALRMITRGYCDRAKPIPSSFVLRGSLNEETVRINLVLTSEKDEDVRELLSHVFPGERGTFIKHALRFYLGPAAVLSGFMDEEFSSMLQNISVPVQVFAVGRVNAKPATPKKRREKKGKVPAPRNKERLQTLYSQPLPLSQDSQILKQDVPSKFTTNNFDCLDTGTQSDVRKVSCENKEDEMLALLEGLLG